MRNKYQINYKLIFTVLTVLYILQVLLVIIVWEKDFPAGILVITIFIAIDIYSIKQLFGPWRVKSVTVDSTAIIIEYRIKNVKIPYGDCKKIEYYKHGRFTERIYVYAKCGFKYEIPFELKDFHDMCGSIYAELSKINMEHIADEWFQEKFGKNASSDNI